MSTMTRALLATVVLAVLGVSTAVHAQSLSDVARKAEEERAKARKAAPKVYTNKDLVSTPATVPEPAVANTLSPAPAGGGTEPGLKDDEAYWKGRTRVLRENVERARKTCVPYEESVRSLENAMSPSRGTKLQGNSMAAARGRLAEAVTELKYCTDRVKNEERALESFQELGRRTGVLPAWLR